MTSPEDMQETAAALRVLLAEVDAGRMVCSAGFRHRVQGAVLALDCLAEDRGGDLAGRLGNDRLRGTGG